MKNRELYKTKRKNISDIRKYNTEYKTDNRKSLRGEKCAVIIDKRQIMALSHENIGISNKNETLLMSYISS